MPSFSDYRENAAEWLTVFETEFYPDILDQAKVLCEPIIRRFAELVGEASDSQDLLRRIAKEKNPARTQILKAFRRYVSPNTSVEMTGRVTKTEETIKNFGAKFRPLSEVRTGLRTRPNPDEALMVLLSEYKDRGKKGYDLTELFFTWFESTHEDYDISGPRRAGRDAILNEILENFEKRTPADFLIKSPEGVPLVVGFARYDSDRGGAQEDDRTSGNRDKITEILGYNETMGANLKILFVNDGPGLLLGLMWSDYADIEEYGAGRVMVCTLKMLDARVTETWLNS